jgi:hypothetical protein
MHYGLPVSSGRLNTFYLTVFLPILLTACVGCGAIWNTTANTPSFETDLTSLLKERAQSTLYKPQYRMIGETKSAVCEFKALPQNINTIANAFDMTEIPSGSKTLTYINYNYQNSKLGTLFKEGKDVKAYGVFGGPAKLKCKSGGAFEYMILFYQPKTNQASIETCYLHV